MNIKRVLRRRLSSVLDRPRDHRRFIDSMIGMTGFFRILKEENLDYIVLSWFESLPHVAPGQHINILVADDDVEMLASHMKSFGDDGDIPTDLYSVSGLPGTSSMNMPYYPVGIARKILNDAVWVNDLVRTPAPDDHFMSLCYHVLYHKGYSSGVPSDDPERNEKVLQGSDPDYVETLKRLYQESGLQLGSLEMTLEGLDRILSEAGWKPDRDTLEKLSRGNQWISDVLSSESMDVPDHLAGLSIFLVRDEGVENLDTIKRILFDQGFDHVIEGKIPE